MAKIDAYLRSIEKFGASGAVLTSGQAVTLRFPSGDRNATQIAPHDQIVAMVREIAPPPALDAIDKGRPGQFDYTSNGIRYLLSVTPRPGAWQLAMEAAPATAAAPTPPARASSPAIAAPDPGEMLIERGQYDQPVVATTSGSGLLDQLTTSARGARATDLYLAAGQPPVIRVGGELHPAGDRGALDADTLSRELGIVAPAEARTAWADGGVASFAYSDGHGRVRATLFRDQGGPGAALRLLLSEPPAIDRLGISLPGWLDQRGLVLIAGASGAGKTTVFASLARALGERRRRVVTIEDPIELPAPGVSQRGVGVHVPSVNDGVAAAMHEGADVIGVGDVRTADGARAVLDAVTAGHLVLACVTSSSARLAIEVLLDLLPEGRRELARRVLGEAHLGTIGATARGGQRSFEVVSGRA